MTAVLEAQGLTRSFGSQRALDGLTLDVQAGEVLALLGPNGAGKTTTVRLLNGVLKPESGSAHVLGLDPWTQGDDLRRRTGVLTENAGLDERLSARENLEFTGRVRGMSAGATRTRVDALLERFGMADKSDEPVQGFSTGERKRIALARALLHDPDVLFLDEPTSGLDPAATRDVVDLIGGLATDHGRAVVLCTHFLGEAGRLAHRMAVLHKGNLKAFGRPQELASKLWDSLDADLDLGAAADERTIASITHLDGVVGAAPSIDGARVRVRDRAVLPVLVAALVAREVPVYAAVPRPPTLEDVYFEIEARVARGEEPLT
jgi:ABC-2 type transport system ATP-binding protein